MLSSYEGQKPRLDMSNLTYLRISQTWEDSLVEPEIYYWNVYLLIIAQSFTYSITFPRLTVSKLRIGIL